jgi:hypothetical protein
MGKQSRRKRARRDAGPARQAAIVAVVTPAAQIAGLVGVDAPDMLSTCQRCGALLWMDVVNGDSLADFGRAVLRRSPGLAAVLQPTVSIICGPCARAAVQAWAACTAVKPKGRQWTDDEFEAADASLLERIEPDEPEPDAPRWNKMIMITAREYAATFIGPAADLAAMFGLGPGQACTG